MSAALQADARADRPPPRTQRLRGADDPLVLAWRAMVEVDLPRAAAQRPDWPVRLDHCFARILLDHACGAPWRDSVRPPAWANMPGDRLEAALSMGRAVLAGAADLDALNARSLGWRGKAGPPRRAVPGETAR